MLIWVIAALLAYFVKGLCGFANTLVFSTTLSFTSSHISISPVELLLGYPTNLLIAFRERRAIRWKLCLPLCLLVLGGSIPGVFFLKNTDVGLIKSVFGFVIAFIGFESLWRDIYPRKGKQSALILTAIGILSGVLCGLYGVGALLGAYLSRITEDSKSFRANLCVVFMAENTFRIVLYAMAGLLTADVLLRALMLAPVMLIGLALGMRCSRVLDECIAKRIVICALIIFGLALSVSSL